MKFFEETENDPTKRMTDKQVVGSWICIALFVCVMSVWATRDFTNASWREARDHESDQNFIIACQNKGGWAFEMKRGQLDAYPDYHSQPAIEWRCFKNEVLIFP